jgi:hypothetical protein
VVPNVEGSNPFIHPEAFFTQIPGWNATKRYLLNGVRPRSNVTACPEKIGQGHNGRPILMARPKAKAPPRHYNLSGQPVVNRCREDFYLGHESSPRY